MISFNFFTIVQINIKFYLKFMHNYYAIYTFACNLVCLLYVKINIYNIYTFLKILF